MHHSSTKIGLAMIGVVAVVMAAPQPVAAENTVVTVTCTGDGAEKGAQEKFSCGAVVVHAKDKPNEALPKSITGINYMFMDVEGEKWSGGRCPTWVLRNGVWVQIC
jgi:hypothetical protein